MLKITKKYTPNMTLMSRYKGQLLGVRSAKKKWAAAERKRKIIILSKPASPSRDYSQAEVEAVLV